MRNYIIRRFLIIIPILVITSFVTFVIIELPPGDFLTSYIENQMRQGGQIRDEEVEALKQRFGLDLPFHLRYLKWISGLVRGNLGMSMEHNRPVNELILERLGFTVLISVLTIIFTWIVSIPVGIYSAIRQYSPTDYLFTFGGFIGLSIPNFFLALIFMYISYKYFGQTISGLFSAEYVGADWSTGKVIDMFKNIWIPVIVVGTAGTAGFIRVVRSQMLDELGKEYIQTARAKGLQEHVVILKHALRVAINPVISTVGYTLPAIFSSGTITGIVLGLPTLGPILLNSLKVQDMFLAGSILMIQTVLVVIGTLISDILLVVVDPRIRYN